jgi:hypothetical protein
MMKNQVLFQSAFQKVADQRGSKNSVRKLSRPAKKRTCPCELNSESWSVPNSGRIITAV